MDFFYFSILNVVPLGIAYGLLVLLYWPIERATRGMQARKVILPIVGAVFLVLPIGEELWVAWNFGQACKDAGTLIHKTVQVEGFYDETGTGSLELVRSGTYRFIESRSNKGITRITLGDTGFMKQALTRFEQENPGKDASKQDVIRMKLEDNVEALVFPKKGDSWRIAALDRPTARYHFRMTDPMDGTPWAHKVIRSGSVVVDSETNQEIARYTNFGRRSPWFFFGQYLPGFTCDEKRRGQFSSNGELIYREVLIPVAR